MAEQPSLSNVSIFRTVRSYRQALRHESIKALTGRLRSLVMSVPSREVLIDETRDVAPSDAFRFGHPVVRYLRPQFAFADAVAGIGGLQAPIVIGQDKFLAKSEANKADDLQADLRAAAGLTNVVDGV